MRAIEMSMEQEIPRKPADQRHRAARFPHAKIRIEPAGDRTRIALVVDEQASRSAIVAPIIRAAVVDRLTYSHPTHKNRVHFPSEVAPGISPVEIVPNDAASRRVFSRSPVSSSLAFRRFARIGFQELDVKSGLELRVQVKRRGAIRAKLTRTPSASTLLRRRGEAVIGRRRGNRPRDCGIDATLTFTCESGFARFDGCVHRKIPRSTDLKMASYPIKDYFFIRPIKYTHMCDILTCRWSAPLTLARPVRASEEDRESLYDSGGQRGEGDVLNKQASDRPVVAACSLQKARRHDHSYQSSRLADLEKLIMSPFITQEIRRHHYYLTQNNLDCRERAPCRTRNSLPIRVRVAIISRKQWGSIDVILFVPRNKPEPLGRNGLKELLTDAATHEYNKFEAAELTLLHPPNPLHRSSGRGAVVVNLVRFPAGSLLDFRMWESCRTMPLVGRPLIQALLHTRQLASPSSALKTSMLRINHSSSLIHVCSWPMRSKRGIMVQRRNERVGGGGETGYPRVNLPTSGIVRERLSGDPRALGLSTAQPPRKQEVAPAAWTTPSSPPTSCCKYHGPSQSRALAPLHTEQPPRPCSSWLHPPPPHISGSRQRSTPPRTASAARPYRLEHPRLTQEALRHHHGVSSLCTFTSVQFMSRQSQYSRALQAPSRTVSFTRRFHTLSSIQATNTSLAVVPQSPVVVHTSLRSRTLARWPPPPPRIFPNSRDESRRAEVPASLTRTFLRRRQTRRNLQQGRGAVTHARRRAARQPAVHYSRVSPENGVRWQHLPVRGGGGRNEVGPPPQCQAAALTETSTPKSLKLAGRWPRTMVLYDDRPMRFPLNPDDDLTAKERSASPHPPTVTFDSATPLPPSSKIQVEFWSPARNPDVLVRPQIAILTVNGGFGLTFVNPASPPPSPRDKSEHITSRLQSSSEYRVKTAAGAANSFHNGLRPVRQSARGNPLASNQPGQRFAACRR
ncbi:hypothetical protein PR048_032635 [Dryococelus australis]|uniref:Uncharacterized protein n=1 Tax=Dryococelus australis TaxID=614101 RepID=A0ABQ9G6V0_9NEOP|nr:hypothetical protein PR048_032635 [Dryococelus australis]